MFLGKKRTPSLITTSKDHPSQCDWQGHKLDFKEELRHQSQTPVLEKGTLDAHLATVRIWKEEDVVAFPSNNPNARAESEYGADSPNGSEHPGHIDWTRSHASMNLKPHLKFVYAFDWGSTVLGPMTN